MQTYTIYIMRVSGLKQARGLRKIGVAKCVEHRRQCIENSLRKEFGKDCLVYIEHAYQIPRRGKGGFKAYNLEHQIQTYLKSKMCVGFLQKVHQQENLNGSEFQRH